MGKTVRYILTEQIGGNMKYRVNRSEDWVLEKEEIRVMLWKVAERIGMTEFTIPRFPTPA